MTVVVTPKVQRSAAIPQTMTLTLGGLQYFLRLTWCEPGLFWVVDIADQNEVPIARGLPLVTGHDLLAQYRHLGIPGSLTVQTDHNPDAVPTFHNLGDTGHLYFVSVV